MDSLFLFYPFDENILKVDLLTNFPQYCVFGVLICLLITYSFYHQVLWVSPNPHVNFFKLLHPEISNPIFCLSDQVKLL